MFRAFPDGRDGFRTEGTVESRSVSFEISRIVLDNSRLFPGAEAIASLERNRRGLRNL